MKAKVGIAAWGAGLLLAFAGFLASASAHAQPATRVVRIGFLALPPLSASGDPARGVANALQGLGYIDGKNAVFDFRYANWQTERLPELAGELARQRVDVIVAIRTSPASQRRTRPSVSRSSSGVSTVRSKPGWSVALPGREAM